MCSLFFILDCECGYNTVTSKRQRLSSHGGKMHDMRLAMSGIREVAPTRSESTGLVFFFEASSIVERAKTDVV